MIELMILGQLWGIRKNTAAMAREENADIEGTVHTVAFLLSILLWPLLIAWPLLKMGAPRWLAFAISVVFGLVAFLVLTFAYFFVGLIVALVSLTVVVIRHG